MQRCPGLWQAAYRSVIPVACCSHYIKQYEAEKSCKVKPFLPVLFSQSLQQSRIVQRRARSSFVARCRMAEAKKGMDECRWGGWASTQLKVNKNHATEVLCMKYRLIANCCCSLPIFILARFVMSEQTDLFLMRSLARQGAGKSAHVNCLVRSD